MTMASMGVKLALDAADKHSKVLAEVDKQLQAALAGAVDGKIDVGAVQGAALALSRAQKEFLTQMTVMKKLVT